MNSSVDSKSYSSFAGVDLLLLHVGSDERILYANTAFCTYFGLDKPNVLNEPVQILQKARKPKLTDAILAGLVNKAGSEENVTDEAGRVFRVLTTWKDEGAFVSIDDISQEEVLKSYVSRYVLRDFENLSEADLTTLHFPERRFMTVSFADLRGFTTLSEKMQPDEIRNTLNGYLGCMIKAVENNHATVDKIMGDGIMILYGAPRYYRDHALRAVKTALDQQAYLKDLRERMAKEERRLPECGIAIHTGEMVVGNIGTAHREDYTVVGANVNLASRICDSAEGGQVLVSESAFLEIVDNLPKGWKAKLEKQDSATTLPPPDEPGKNIIALDIQQQGASCTVGPEGSPAFRFHYVYAMQYKGVSRPVPILEATVLEGVGISLSDRAAHQSGEKLFGKYSLQERIGRGRSSEVWKARDEFGNRVALKILQSRGAEENVKRFKREAEIMRALDHPNICRMLELGIYEEKHYIAMEFVPGHHLRDWVEREFPPKAASSSAETICPPQDAVKIMSQVLSAVNYAHSKGVIHRDLKPENIMIKPNGAPVIMDFGLGRFESATHSVTLGGEYLGSIEFMAPEQASGAILADKKSDIFSAGAVLFLLLTGKKWYKGTGNILADTVAISKQEIPAARSFNPNIHRRLNEILSLAMRRDPTERYDSAQAFADDLEGFSQRVQRAKPIKALVLGIIIAGLLLLPLVVRERIREYASWGAPTFVEDFSDLQSFKNNWVTVDNFFNLGDGSAEMATDAGFSATAVLKTRLRIPVACEFDLIYPVGTKTIQAASVVWREKASVFFRGIEYYFAVGTQGTANSNFSKFGDDFTGRISVRGQEKPVVRGVPYRVRIEIEPDLISLYGAGNLIASYQDPFPISQGFIGFVLGQQGLAISNFKVYSKGGAEKVSVLDIGEAFQLRGYYRDGLAEYKRIIASFPSRKIREKAMLSMAECYVMLGQEDSAEQVVDSLLLDNLSGRAMLLKADFLRKRGDHTKAAQQLRAAYRNGGTRQKLLVKAKLESWMAKFPQMIFVRTTQRLFPDDPRTIRVIARALISLGCAQEVLDDYPQYPEACAEALLAQKEYRRVLKEYPDQRRICGLALFRLGEYQKVIDEYKQAHSARVRSFLELGEFQRVLDEYPEAHSWCAMALTKMGKADVAMQRYRNNDGAMALVLNELGRHEEVLEKYPHVASQVLRAKGFIARKERSTARHSRRK